MALLAILLLAAVVAALVVLATSSSGDKIDLDQVVKENVNDQIDALRQVVDDLRDPAYVTGERWDVLAWNRLNSIFFRDYSTTPPAERNLVEILFSKPGNYEDPLEYENIARRVLAKVRVDYSKSGGNDPRFEALIRRLCTLSPVFRRIWRAPEINVRSFGMHRFRHPRHGDLAFEHTSYVPDGHPDVRVVICMPHDAQTKAAVAKVWSEIAATE